MKFTVALGLAVSALASTSGSAGAGGLDVVRQSYDVLFESGTAVQGTVTRVRPSIDGDFAGIPADDVGPSYWTGSLGFKTDINGELSVAAVLDRPYYNEISFPASLGSVYGRYWVDELTGLARYKFADTWSVFGGVRIDRAGGETSAAIAPYPDFTLHPGYGAGFIGGAAYEIQDFGVLARLAYKSPVKFSLDGSGAALGVPGLLDGTYHVELPQSVMFDARVPINERTFVFGSVAWNQWSKTKVKIYQNLGADTTATNFSDDWVLSAGAGRFLSDSFILSGTFIYDTGSKKSPGYDTVYSDEKTVALGLTYMQDKFRITGPLGYTFYGNSVGTNAALGGIPVSYKDNTALSGQLQFTFKL